jgi:hypothetical protein
MALATRYAEVPQYVWLVAVDLSFHRASPSSTIWKNPNQPYRPGTYSKRTPYRTFY